MSFMLTVPRAGRMMMTQFVVSSAHGHTHERLPEDYTCDRILIFGLEGELFFGATAALERHLETMEAAVTDNTQVMVLRLKRSRNPDAVALSLPRIAQHGPHLAILRKTGFSTARCTRILFVFQLLSLPGLFARLGLMC